MDEPRTRKEVANEDRADPEERGGWFFGPDAVRVLVRAFWGATLVSGLGILLLGTCAWYLREIVHAILDLAVAMKGK